MVRVSYLERPSAETLALTRMDGEGECERKDEHHKGLSLIRSRPRPGYLSSLPSVDDRPEDHRPFRGPLRCASSSAPFFTPYYHLLVVFRPNAWELTTTPRHKPNPPITTLL